FFSSRRPHTRFSRDWSSDVCSSDLDGSFVVLINTKGTSWMVDAIAWAQRFDGDGNPMWDNAVQVSTITTRSNMRYKIMQENDVVYYAYYGATGFRFDVFLQRINADGTRSEERRVGKG